MEGLGYGRNGYRYLEGRSRFAEVCPGDGTRYEFVVTEINSENLFIAGNLCRGYQMCKDSVREHGTEWIKGWGKNGAEERVILNHHYIGYLNEEGHMGKANPWTIRAAVLAAFIALEAWDIADTTD